MSIRSQLGLHSLNGRLIGKLERPAECVCQQFTAEIVNEVLLPMLADVGLQGLQPGALAAAGKNRLGIDRASGEVLGTPLADGPVAFENEAEGIEARGTGGGEGGGGRGRTGSGAGADRGRLEATGGGGADRCGGGGGAPLSGGASLGPGARGAERRLSDRGAAGGGRGGGVGGAGLRGARSKSVCASGL